MSVTTDSQGSGGLTAATSAPPPSPPPPSTPTRRRPGGLPIWAWVVIAVGVVGSALMALLVLVGINLMLTHDLLDEDFSASQSEFSTGQNEGYTFAVESGTYVVTSRVADAGGANTFANLARTAFAVRADVDVVAMPLEPDAFVGIACGGPGATDGYYLVARGSGPGVALLRINASNFDSPDVLAMDESADLATVQSMSLECTKRAVGEIVDLAIVDLAGYVNGDRVLTATDADGINGFDTVVLHFASPEAGASAVFDNVRVVVPE